MAVDRAEDDFSFWSPALHVDRNAPANDTSKRNSLEGAGDVEEISDAFSFAFEAENHHLCVGDHQQMGDGGKPLIRGQLACDAGRQNVMKSPLSPIVLELVEASQVYPQAQQSEALIAAGMPSLNGVAPEIITCSDHHSQSIILAQQDDAAVVGTAMTKGEHDSVVPWSWQRSYSEKGSSVFSSSRSSSLSSSFNSENHTSPLVKKSPLMGGTYLHESSDKPKLLAGNITPTRTTKGNKPKVILARNTSVPTKTNTPHSDPDMAQRSSSKLPKWARTLSLRATVMPSVHSLEDEGSILWHSMPPASLTPSDDSRYPKMRWRQLLSLQPINPPHARLQSSTSLINDRATKAHSLSNPSKLPNHGKDPLPQHPNVSHQHQSCRHSQNSIAPSIFSWNCFKSFKNNPCYHRNQAKPSSTTIPNKPTAPLCPKSKERFKRSFSSNDVKREVTRYSIVPLDHSNKKGVSSTNNKELPLGAIQGAIAHCKSSNASSSSLLKKSSAMGMH